MKMERLVIPGIKRKGEKVFVLVHDPIVQMWIDEKKRRLHGTGDWPEGTPESDNRQSTP